MTAPRDIPADPKIIRAAQHLADLPKFENGLRRRLREDFRLDDSQISEAISLSAQMRLLRSAHA